MDHLSELHDDLKRIPPVVTEDQPPAGFEAGAQALGGWLDATKDPNETPDQAIFKALEAASKQLDKERKTSRAKILEETALQRTPMATARVHSRSTRVGRSYPLSLVALDRLAENRFQ